MGVKQRARLRPVGIVEDLPPEDVGPDNWTSGNNVNFRDDVTSRVLGYEGVLGTPLIDPVALLYAPNNQVPLWIYLSIDKIVGTDGAVHNEMTPLGWQQSTLPNTFTLSTLNTVPIINNALDAPVYAPNGIDDLCLDLPDWPASTTCYAMRPYRNFLVAMHISGPGGDDVDLVQWSDAAAAGQVPQAWTPTADNQAGNNVIGDTIGAIIDGLTLRGDFIIYKEDSVHLMTLVGGLEVMSFRTLFTNTGILGRNCVVEVSGRHYVMTDGDIMVHDGQNISSIIDKRNRETLFKLIDKDNAALSFVMYHDAASEVWFCVPSLGSTRANVAAVYSIEDDRWSFRDLPDIMGGISGTVPGAPGLGVTWESITDTWESVAITWNQVELAGLGEALLVASPDITKIYEMDSSVTGDGATVSAIVTREKLDLDTPDTVKLVSRIWPRIAANQGAVINVRVGGSINVNDTPVYSPAVPFTVGTSVSVDVLVSGKFISVEFSSAEDILWRLTSWDIEYSLAASF